MTMKFEVGKLYKIKPECIIKMWTLGKFEARHARKGVLMYVGEMWWSAPQTRPGGRQVPCFLLGEDIVGLNQQSKDSLERVPL